MSPQAIQMLLMMLGRTIIAELAERGKFDKAAFLTDALAALQAGRNIDVALGKLAEQWAQGEPPLADITAARIAIQASMKDTP